MLTTASASAARGGVRGEGTPELGPPRPSYSAGSAFKASARRALTERGYSTHLWVSLQYTPGLVGKGAPGLIGHMALPVTGWRSRRRFRRRAAERREALSELLERGDEAVSQRGARGERERGVDVRGFVDVGSSCLPARPVGHARGRLCRRSRSVGRGRETTTRLGDEETHFTRTERLRETNATVASREEDNDARGGPVICPRTPSPSTSRALRVPVRRVHLQAGTRARFARRHAVFVRLARARRSPVHRARLHARTRALFGRWDASLRASSQRLPHPRQGVVRPRCGRRGVEVEPWEAQPSPFAPAPTPEYAPSRPSEFDPARRAPEAPAPPAPEGDPLRPFEPRPDETSLPAPLVPDPEQRPAREPPAAPPPSGPGPVLVPPESTLTPNPPHRMSPTRPSSDRPRPKSPARWTRRVAKPWRPADSPGSALVNKVDARSEQSQRGRVCTPPHEQSHRTAYARARARARCVSTRNVSYRQSLRVSLRARGSADVGPSAWKNVRLTRVPPRQAAGRGRRHHSWAPS